MGWARIDDGFDDHPKVLAVLEYEQGAAAVGLWTLCLTWAHRNTRKRGKVPGLLPVSLPRRYLGPGARELAELLVTEKLWEDRGPEGWMIHDFERYLPNEQTRGARSEAGKRGAARKPGGVNVLDAIAICHQVMANLWRLMAEMAIPAPMRPPRAPMSASHPLRMATSHPEIAICHPVCYSRMANRWQAMARARRRAGLSLTR